ncbi:MAG: hypothetical protein Aurels2KO_51830 [Aureliella sp.]
MKKRPALSKGEMEIARLLWDAGPCTVRQIHESVCEYRDADFATIQTFLRRIEAKGYASSKLDGNTRIYTAAARPKAVIRDAVDDFVGRLFGGDGMPLVRHLIEERSIDPAEIGELKRLVAKLEKEAKERQG